jgi:putative phage-type endonuclease
MLMTTVEKTEENFENRFTPEVRKLFIGGTDIAAILKMHPFRKKYRVWQEKTGRRDPENLEDNEAVFWGSFLEDKIADRYAVISGNKVRNVNRTLIHPKYDFLRGHIDRKIVGQDAGLEVKTVGLRSAYLWGEPGTDEIPLHYEIQILHYIAITGYHYFDIAALFFGQEMRIYHVSRKNNLGRIKQLEDAAREFWESHVLTDIPPIPESTEETSMAYPEADRGKVATLTHGQEHLVSDVHNLSEDMETLKAKLDSAKTIIQNTMGDAEVLDNLNGYEVATWKNSSRNGKTFRTFRMKRRRDDE